MADKTGKKLINSVDRCVDENLDGFVRVNPGIELLKGHRVVVRADIASVISAGKVTLVSGGGSGHEPAHAGYVGKGMLSAAVAGSVFTSPPPGDILAAIRAVGSNNPAGTLLIIKNYTGDRLNFGLAAERAKGEGLKVAMVVVDEDCALASADRTAGRRGLCGTVIVHKLAGTLAEEGKSLDDIQTYLAAAVRRMGTIGLSLTACSVPGSGPSFTLGADQMELGLGIHGEAGVQRMKLVTAKEAVSVMIDHMTRPDTDTSLKLQPGDEVACMVNNLGGTSVLEMNILAGEACTYLESMGLVVSRLYNGSFMTSLEMAGFSITILILDDTSTRCLDAPTSAPGWAKPFLPSGASVRKNPTAMMVTGSTQKSQEKTTGFVKVSNEISAAIYQAVKGACESLIGAEEELNALDTQSGDGDCGTTHRHGAQAILEELGSAENSGFSLDCPAALTLSLANCVEEKMGGSSGALYSLFLTAASHPLQKATGVGAFSAALKEGNSAMQRYGGACPGDRTMLDALTAASQKLIALENSGLSPAEIFKQVAKAAEEGARSTVGMRAQAGRASYVNPDFLTKPDPGAMGVALWMRGASDALTL